MVIKIAGDTGRYGNYFAAIIFFIAGLYLIGILPLPFPGTGCPKCQKLTENTEATAKEIGIDYEIEKVTEINKIMEFGVMMTPALAVDSEVKVVGRMA